MQQPTIQNSTVELIGGFEGFVGTPYKDQGGVWTIGYGFTQVNGHAVTEHTPAMTQEQADQIMSDILPTYGQAVLAATPDATLNENQYNACLSLCYNIGTQGFATSTVARQINAGNFQRAANAFLLWNKVNGQVNAVLVARRQKERQVFLS